MGMFFCDSNEGDGWIIVLVASLRDADTYIARFTTLRDFVACMVLIAPVGACHAFGMSAWLMMTYILLHELLGET